MYVLRYKSDVPLKEREHHYTLGTYESESDAILGLSLLEDEIQNRLEIQSR